MMNEPLDHLILLSVVFYVLLQKMLIVFDSPALYGFFIFRIAITGNELSMTFVLNESLRPNV